MNTNDFLDGLEAGGGTNMESETVRYPDISVRLIGTDGNAFALMGKVSTALRSNGVSAEEVKHFQTTCMSGDYNHLLNTCMDWVNVL